jgi:hypothetical protein
MVVVFGLNSPEKELSDYIMEKIVDHLVAKDKMKVVDRQRPDLIRAEMDIQNSDDVDPRYAKSLGKQFGGDYVISGSLKAAADLYELRLIAINVETALVEGTRTETIKMDKKLAVLLKSNWTDPNAWKNKKVYFGARGGVTFPRVTVDAINISGSTYDLNEKAVFDDSGPNFGVEISYQFFDFFALQTEVYFQIIPAQRWVSTDMFEFRLEKHFDITVPLLAKLTFRPSIFSLEAFAGPSLNFITYNGRHAYDGPDEEHKFSIAVVIGGRAGVKVGKGILFLDLRDYLEPQDVSLLIDTKRGAEIQKGKRNNFLISIGYSVGIIDK